jgi:uncharacterized protein
MGKPVVHFEIGCKDKSRAAKFYEKLFGWKIQATGPAAVIDTASNGKGISGHITALGHEPHHYVLVYIEVEDLAPHLKDAEALGGKVAIPPVALPDGRKFAWLTDPDGNTIGIVTPIPKAAK